MPRLRPGETARHAEYARQVGPVWECLRCGSRFGSRGGVQLHQRTHRPHVHRWRILRGDRADETRAIAAGMARVCVDCWEVE